MTEQNTALKIHADTIDWSSEWKRAYTRASVRRRRPNDPAFWEKNAKRFSTIDNGAAGRVMQMVERLAIDGSTTILDIGCGPGNLTVPLAKIAGSVTAIDPAPAMLKSLEKLANKEGVDNIRTLCRSWEDVTLDVDIPTHDIVLSSYSMIMQEVGTALAAMNTAARHTVCLFWVTGHQTFGYDEFWTRLFSEPYVSGPDHVMLLNILNDMAIYPDVAIFPQYHVTRYLNLDEAVASWAENLHVSSKSEKDTICNFLQEKLTQEGNQLVYAHPMRTAMIWWNKDCLNDH